MIECSGVIFPVFSSNFWYAWQMNENGMFCKENNSRQEQESARNKMKSHRWSMWLWVCVSHCVHRCTQSKPSNHRSMVSRTVNQSLYSTSKTHTQAHTHTHALLFIQHLSHREECWNTTLLLLSLFFCESQAQPATSLQAGISSVKKVHVMPFLNTPLSNFKGWPQVTNMILMGKCYTLLLLLLVLMFWK